MNVAHVHLILNHIPVLGGVAVLILLAVAKFKKNEAITKLTLQTMVLVGILSLPAYFTGEPAEELVEHLPGVTKSFVHQHEKIALFSIISTELLAAIGVLGLLVLRKNPKKIIGYWNSIGVIALINAALMIATANLGGEIRHTEIRKNEISPQTINQDKPVTNEEKGR